MSCWKLGCRETWAWARVCRTPRTPSRTSPIHSVCRAAIVLELNSHPGRWCQQCGWSEGAGRRSRGHWRDPYLWAWLGLHPGPRDSPLQARDAGGGQSREPSCRLAPHTAAYVRGSDQDPPGPCHLGLGLGRGLGGLQAEAPANFVLPPVPAAWMGVGARAPGPPATSGPGTPSHKPYRHSVSRSRDPGRGHCSYGMSLVLEGLAGWVVTGNLGPGKGTQSAPQCGRRARCAGHGFPTVSCRGSGLWSPGYPSQPGPPLRAGPAHQCGPAAPRETGGSPYLGHPPRPGLLTATCLPASAGLRDTPTLQRGLLPELTRVALPLLQPKVTPGRRGLSSGPSGVDSADQL